MANVQAPPTEQPTAETTRETPTPPAPRKRSPPPPSTADDLPKLPRPISKNLNIKQLLEYWGGVPSEFGPRLSGYLYRWWPILIRPDGEHNIAIYAEAPTMDDLLKEWGAGTYQLKLKDKDAGKELCVATFDFDVQWSDHPPSLNPGELDMQHRKNQSYIQWAQGRGLLKMNNQQGGGESAILAQALVQATKVQPQSEASAVKAAVDVMREASKTAIDVVKDQQTRNAGPGYDPIALIAAIEKTRPAPFDPIALVNAINGSKPAAPAADPRIDLLISELKESRQQNTALLTRLLDRQDKPANEDSITKRVVDAAITRLLDREGGGSGKRSPWVEALDVAAPHLEKLTDTLGFFGQGFASMWAARARMAGVGQPGTGRRPNPPAAAAGLPSGQQHPQAPPQESQPQNPTGEDDPMKQQLLMFFAANWAVVKHWMEEDRPGQALAEYLMDGGVLKPMAIEMMRSATNPQQILSILQSEPEIWAEVGPYATQLERLLTEFLAWEPGWDEGIEDPPPPGPAPVIPISPGGKGA